MTEMNAGVQIDVEQLIKDYEAEIGRQSGLVIKERAAHRSNLATLQGQIADLQRQISELQHPVDESGPASTG